ncbi:DUF308 domain-containing protein [Mycobacterium sp. 155]|uniref:HdeD family acid-resistance protein n=1 Tax=Mycobacterium sp. 155 TaxID=1157943 RepID=UPI0003614849
MTASESPPVTIGTVAAILWRAAIVWGVLAVILGTLMLLWPKITVLAAAILFGAYLLAAGVAQVISAFGLDVSAGSRILLFVSGVLSVILAIMAFRHFSEGLGIWLLAIWIGVGFIFQGVSEVVLAVSYRDLPGKGWPIFSGVVSVAAGVTLLAWPINSIVTLAMVTGAFLIVIGLMQVVKAFQFRGGAKAVARHLSNEPASVHR